MLHAILVLSLAAVPQSPSEPPAREQASSPASVAPSFAPAWKRLLGEWSGEGDGAPGAGGGRASFRLELDGHVIVRRSVADYPAAQGRPATHHEDLLVLHPGNSPAEASAIYFDNEGHVISYLATWSSDGAVLTLVSPAGVAGPRFRLTYTFPDAGALAVSFEIAAPGGSEFRKYVSGTMRRVPDR